jgi:tetratricopeptide (TPR) repeat protein
MLTMMLRRLAAPLLAALLLLAPAAALARAAAPQAGSDTVLVLPFENTSGLREYHWIGESFADSLADLLGAHGLRVVTPDARELAYQRLRLPAHVIPSRATAIKLAREAGATLVVLGNYEVSPARDEKSVAEARGSAKLVRVNEGRISGKEMPDGRWATHEFFFGDALVNLQAVQGKLAYQILYEQNPLLHYSQNAVVEAATKVPPRAFEAYVKGTMLPNTHPDKSGYLQNAMHEFAKANPGSVYKQAAFELGHLYFDQRDYKRAAEHFSMLQERDPHHAEAAFYASLSYWHSGELQSAMDALLPATQSTPLASIFNNAGALAAQAARAEKNAARREALLKQATNVLGRAVESTPDDPYVRYNYAHALLLSGKYAEAAEQLRELLKSNPKNPEGLFLLAKAQEKAGQSDAAETDNEARKVYANYGKAQVEWQQAQTTTLLPFRLQSKFDRAVFIITAREEEDKRRAQVEGPGSQDLLARARELYAGGRDDEALAELRNVVRIEPNNAEAYLLTGRIYLRRGELASAINQLKTSIFWDKSLIDPHILLGRIFLERGDQAQARAYAQSAMQLDPNNPEAIALQRQLQVGIK